MAELNHYNFESLPDFIRESKHCENWRELFPNETVFSCSDDMYLDSLDINTPEDFAKIIECEALHLFTQHARIKILRNIETFWMETPYQIELPKKGASWFGDQVICLFETKGDPFICLNTFLKDTEKKYL